MNFCFVCDNMLFIRNLQEEGGEQKVQYFCKYCNNSEEFESVNRDKFSSEDGIIPKYISHDVTLPRRNDVTCTNCNSGKEIILLRVDNNNKFFNYYCVDCKKTFTGQS